MPDTRTLRRARLPLLLAVVGAVAATVAITATQTAQAATLFSDDFEQPTANVWQTGGGGVWTTAVEDGTHVFRQTSTSADTVAWAGSGAGSFTAVTGRVKPTSAPGSGAVGLLSKVANPNNYYYVVLRGSTLEIGRRSFGTITPLASTPFTAQTGSWYSLTLNLFFTGQINASVSGPDGASARLSTADPGGTNFGGAVGFWSYLSSASFDDIKLSDDRVLPPSSTPPTVTTAPACPVAITFTLVNQWPGGFQVAITIRNITVNVIAPGWVLRFRFSNGQVITNVFSVASWSQTGSQVIIIGPPWGGLNPGASFWLGFLGSGTNPPGSITDVTFNGIPCSAL